jgi:hypothetical protein
MNPKNPDNSWELYLDIVKKATSIINKILDNKPMGPLLTQFMHIMIFQQGISVARWVNNNEDLVRRLNAIQTFTKEEFEQIASEVKASTEKMVKI